MGELPLRGLLFVFGAFALVSAAGMGLAQRASSEGAARASSFLRRSVRSFTYGQIALAIAVLLTVAFARFTSGPIGPFPGGPFEDPPSAGLDPEGWRIDGNEIQLQIPGDPPYTITTHAFVIDGALYVGADFVFPFKTWVAIVRQDPHVLVRVAGDLFQRRAVHISDPVQSRRILEEVSRQRGVDPDDWLTDVWFFRMDPPS